MKRIGLTGNIGTGKSTVARIFQVLGIPVYHADLKARTILDSAEVKVQLVHHFGATVLDNDHNVDRKALSSLVFADKDKLTALNQLIHPKVEADFLQWCAFHQEEDYILQEAAILFESGFDRLFDSTILVTAPPELCVTRVMARDGVTEEMVAGRIRNQWPQEKKQQLADYMIVNDDVRMVIPQVLAIHQALRK